MLRNKYPPRPNNASPLKAGRGRNNPTAIGHKGAASDDPKNVYKAWQKRRIMQRREKQNKNEMIEDTAVRPRKQSPEDSSKTGLERSSFSEQFKEGVGNLLYKCEVKLIRIKHVLLTLGKS